MVHNKFWSASESDECLHAFTTAKDAESKCFFASFGSSSWVYRLKPKIHCRFLLDAQLYGCLFLFQILKQDLALTQKENSLLKSKGQKAEDELATLKKAVQR